MVVANAVPDPEESRLESEIQRLEEIKKLESEIKELEGQRKWLRKNWSIKFYQILPDGSAKGPHKKQAAFHADKSQIRIVSGGNRTGKSTSGGAEGVAHALGYRPWLPKDDPNYKVDIRIPNKGLVVGESFQEQVRKVLIPKLIGDPENGIPGFIPTTELAGVKRNPQGVITTISFKNGSQIFLQSYDQDLDLFESADYDWCWLDEPCPRPIWVSIQRGMMDRRGRTWMTMTPLTCAWIYDELYSRKEVGLHYFDITDNIDYGLTKQAVEEFSANLTDDEKEARLHGKFFHLVGLVYKKFNKDVHLKNRDRLFAKSDGKVPKHWGMWMHIDTHPRTPHHAVWIAISPNQRKFVVGELKNSDPLNRVEPFCEAVKVYEKYILGRGGDSIVRLIDPIAKTNDPGRDDGKSMYDLFADYGVRCNAGSKNRDAGILLMQNHIDYDLEEGRFPSLFVLDDMAGVIHQILHYQWDEFPLKTQQKQDAKQTPIKKDDHYIEGIHRILLDDPVCEMVDEEDIERTPVTTGRNSVTGY